MAIIAWRQKGDESGSSGSGSKAGGGNDAAFVPERSCRDIFFLLLFTAFWVGMAYVAQQSVAKGDFNRLLYSYDGFGELCGEGGRGKNLHWANPASFLLAAVQGGASLDELPAPKAVCVDECPTAAVLTDGGVDIGSILGDRDKLETMLVCAYKGLYDTSLDAATNPAEYYKTAYAFDIVQDNPLSPNTVFDWCDWVVLPTAATLNRCVPDLDAEGAANYTTRLLETYGPRWSYGAVQIIEDGFSDMYKSYRVWLICGLAVPLVGSFVWVAVLRYFSGVFAWLTVLLVNLATTGLALFCLLKAGIIGEDELSVFPYDIPDSITNPDEANQEVLTYVAYVACALAGLLLLATLVLIPRIKIAIAVVKVASQAIGTMPLLIFFPFIPFLMSASLITYFALIGAMIYSAADVTPACDVAARAAGLAAGEEDCWGYQREWSEDLRYMFLYHLFGYLWTNQVIVGIALTTIAGAVATFYWARGDSNAMPGMPVFAAFKRTFRYHLGSICFGGLVVAIIQFVRVIVEYIDKKTKDAQQTNQMLKYIMCCVRYCLWYLEKIVKFLNRNAYILIAVKGKGYCSSVSHAAGLLVRNALRVVAVNTVGDALPFLGKLLISAGCGILTFVLLDQNMFTEDSEQVSSPCFPVIFTVLFAFHVASCFFLVYEMAVDTILLSFCEDCDTHDGNPRYAPELLLAAVGQANKRRKEKQVAASG